MTETSKLINISLEVLRAQQKDSPVVALESTVITHGLPRPQNLILAQDMEQIIRDENATPATIAVMNGKIQAGLNSSQLEQLANADDAIKVSLRDFATALTQTKPGGTTVAGTMFVAQQVGIKVFATGGIGGVHKEAHLDISTDLQSLATIPIMVVCAGAKSILDLPATLEYLETLGVPVVGYRTDKFPEFYSVGKDLPVSIRLDTPEEVVKFAKTHWDLGLKSAVLVCQPLPASLALSAEEMAPYLRQASEEVIQKQKEHKITGQQVTPYELSRVSELTRGKSLTANLELLKNNARLAAQLAQALSGLTNRQKQL